MLDCGLCQKKFHTKHKLVQHFSEAHSIARQRARRTKISSMLQHMLGDDKNNTLKEYDHQNGDKIIWTTKQPIICDGCGIQFSVESSLLSHKCGFSNTREQTNMKQLVACEYCGRMYKDSRGVAIHQAFCVKRQKTEPTETYDPEITAIEPHMMNILTWYECPAEDCGAVFKDQNKLLCHLDKHHAGENLTLLPNSSPSPTPLQVANHVTIENYSSDPYKVTFNKPMVTVTMKPHIGKTEGLQDLSLLVTPTKGMEEIPEISNDSSYVYNLSKNQLENDDNTGTITVEECKLSEDHFPIKSEAILYLAEDGSVIHTSREKHRKIENLQELEEERTFLLITEDDCNVELSGKAYSGKEKNNTSKKSNIKFSVDSKQGILPKASIIKMENEHFEFESDEYISESDMENWKTKYIDEDDEDWEVIKLGKKKKMNSKTNSRKSEHSCTLCGHTFLTELGYQSHLKNRDCRNKKFKLPRMFECHYLNCESSFFKLTELQRHWQVAHDYSMKSSMHEFDSEKDFSSWLVSEEEKYKVRYTCDVRRKKPTRDERLLICHRYHHLRTAAARKVNKRDYSDKHNWVHKITPCLCYARMKVYQDFDKDTCDYTGKIRVTYYYEHKHPEDDVSLNVEVIDHILLRNKRDREKRFQDMKGPEKVQHRQKLERLAREAGKDYRITLRETNDINPSIKNEKPTHAYNEDIEMETAMAVEHVTSNLLENDELFANQVEMVLDGQFDMNPEMLSGDVAEHNLDGLAIFGAQEEYTTVSTPEEVEELNSLQFMLPASTNDWSKLFELVQARISRDDVSDSDKAEAALVMPYEKVIELIPPSERIPIFRRLLDLANPNSDTDEEVQFEISMIS